MFCLQTHMCYPQGKNINLVINFIVSVNYAKYKVKNENNIKMLNQLCVYYKGIKLSGYKLLGIDILYNLNGSKCIFRILCDIGTLS